jgi:hypothetical protein
VLSQGDRTGQIQCFRLLLSSSVEHLLFQSGIINTKFYALTAQNIDRFGSSLGDPSPSGKRSKLHMMKELEMQLRASLGKENVDLVWLASWQNLRTLHGQLLPKLF